MRIGTILSASPVMFKIDAQYNRNAEDILSVWDWIEERLFYIRAREDTLPLLFSFFQPLNCS